MKISLFFKDKIPSFILSTSFYLITLLMFLAFKIDSSLIIVFSISFFLLLLSLFLISYFKKKSFYNQLLFNIENLDKSYLVLETINKPNFYEGKLLYQALYDINKSMSENIKSFSLQTTDFKQYIEMWIHEIKIPISSLNIMAHNHKDKFDKKTLKQMKKIENYVDQVLYYVRSNNSEKDYLINEVELNKVIMNVALKNKDSLLEQKIDFIVPNINNKVYTDSKWLEFILNQIINNSIKYKKETTNSYIKVEVIEESDKTILTITDNGIGIPTIDLPRVFEKTFTGNNGRLKTKSTGMGLFIAKNLCNKLGHKINIESKEGEYTKVFIIFSKNKYYEVAK